MPNGHDLMTSPHKAEIAKSALERYAKGELIADIAAEHGIADITLYRYLNANFADEFRTLKVSKAEKEYDEAEKELDTASDALVVSRARERLRSRQWRLERLNRKEYGNNVEPSGVGAVQININLRSAPQQDGTVIDVTQSDERV